MGKEKKESVKCVLENIERMILKYPNQSAKKIIAATQLPYCSNWIDGAKKILIRIQDGTLNRKEIEACKTWNSAEFLEKSTRNISATPVPSIPISPVVINIESLTLNLN